MWRINIILGLSFLIVLLPFLGIPQFVDNILYVVFGVLMFVSAFLLRRVRNNVQEESQNRSGKESDESGGSDEE